MMVATLAGGLLVATMLARAHFYKPWERMAEGRAQAARPRRSEPDAWRCHDGRMTAPPAGPPVDLLVRANRVVSPDLAMDGPGAVAIRGDRIVASGADAAALQARRVVDLGDAVLLPGLVDLHAHPDRRPDGSKYGVDPDVEFLRRGVTTLLSQGDAGAGDWEAWVEKTAAAEPDAHVHGAEPRRAR